MYKVNDIVWVAGNRQNKPWVSMLTNIMVVDEFRYLVEVYLWGQFGEGITLHKIWLNESEIFSTKAECDELYKKLDFEKASYPSQRIQAIEKLQANGFDVQVRLSPFIREYIDFNVLNSIKCDKILVEFLRVNTWIRKWFDIDYSDYTVKQSGYYHLPLEKKKALITNLTGFKEMTVCEDESEAYEYWKNNFNANKNDCCNLRLK